MRRVPVVELPVGATEDRLVGTLHLEQAIREGSAVFEPGLLASANRGILYVDEVNLLGDHLVDVLLDAAAMGRNYVEREGISLSHPAQFILVGTMNPEEGDLRPQLLDRFALAVQVEGLRDPDERAEVVRRRVHFERDPAIFTALWQEEEAGERGRIVAARERLPSVVVDDAMLRLITQICTAYQIDGLRGDIVMYRTATALAAYAGRERVTVDDVRGAAELALPHRRRRGPFDDPAMENEKLDEVIREHTANEDDDESQEGGGGEEEVFAPTEPFEVRAVDTKERVPHEARTGRRKSFTAGAHQGRQVGARPLVSDRAGDLAIAATVRAAAPHQRLRRARHAHGPALLIERADWHEKVRESHIGHLVLFVVDASGSMSARRRMEAVKGAVLSLLLDAYQKRDRVGVIAFRGASADLLLPPTNSVDLAHHRLRALPTGGRTPLAHALRLGGTVLGGASIRAGAWVPWVVLVTDGRPNVPLVGADPVVDALRTAEALRARGVRALVIDTEDGRTRLGLNTRIAEALGARCLRLDELGAGAMVGVVRHHIWADA